MSIPSLGSARSYGTQNASAPPVLRQPISKDRDITHFSGSRTVQKPIPREPSEIFERIVAYIYETQGEEGVLAFLETIDETRRTIEDPANKRILIKSHLSPDGDAFAVALGGGAGLEGNFPDRQVDVLIDDNVPASFRTTLPDTARIKRIYDPEKLTRITREIETREKQIQKGESSAVLEKELAWLKNLKTQEEAKVREFSKHYIQPDAEYDLVIVADIPDPNRFPTRAKAIMQKAKNIVFLDHHPDSIQRWLAGTARTGLDMKKINEKKRAWVMDSLPACAEMMAIIVALLPGNIGKKPIENDAPMENSLLRKLQNLQARFVRAIITGMKTDTGNWYRRRNNSEDDKKLSPGKLPDYDPKGLALYLAKLTQNHLDPADRVDEAFVDERIKGKLPASVSALMERLMLGPESDGNRTGITYDEDTGLATLQLDFDQVRETLYAGQAEDPAFNLSDAFAPFKYAEEMYEFKREDPSVITAMIIQAEKQGALSDDIYPYPTNALTFSIRSGDGTNYARILASLFGGGGHGAAAGAILRLPGITQETPLAVKIDGVIQKDPAVILEKLRENLPNPEKLLYKIEVVPDDKDGKPAAELLNDLVKVLRQEEQKKTLPPKDDRFVIKINDTVESNLSTVLEKQRQNSNRPPGWKTPFYIKVESDPAGTPADQLVDDLIKTIQQKEKADTP